MITVATVYHQTSSDVDEKPTLKCKGTCQKVYWPHDFEAAVFGVQIACPKCSGPISSAVEGRDFDVLELVQNQKINPPSTVLHLSKLHKDFIHLQEAHNWK